MNPTDKSRKDARKKELKKVRLNTFRTRDHNVSDLIQLIRLIHFVNLIHLIQNKKQRLAVRQAVIKQKDPHQILAELERLDDIGKWFDTILE